MSTGAYGRTSCDLQKKTSIVDQFRNCKTVAAKNGLVISENMFFSDEAITGKSEGISKRSGYKDLMNKVNAGVVTTIIADEISRLTRGFGEGGRLIELVEQKGIRIITADGMDTNLPNWKMLFGFKIITADNEVGQTSDRTRRGMVGALERGFQIAPVPFGYLAKRDLKPGLKGSCTIWEKDVNQAKWVIKIFELKYSGTSLNSIAKFLNDNNVPSPGRNRKNAALKWRVGTVFRILKNTIYRGVFMFNGSYTFMHEARKRRKSFEPTLYAREGLRLVSDDVWYACNPSQAPGASINVTVKRYSSRGGGTHLFSGLVRCGDCGALLTVSGGPKSFGMHCPQCETSVRANAQEAWIGYTSVAAATHALREVLEKSLSEKFVKEFHQRLSERLSSDPVQHEQAVKAELKKIKDKVERLKSLASNPSLSPDLFIDDLSSASSEMNRLTQSLAHAHAQVIGLNEKVVDVQKAVDVRAVLAGLLNSTDETFKVKSVLKRLLSRFEFVARPRQGVSVFEIEYLLGVAAAEASDTNVIDPTAVAWRVTVSVSKKRPVTWDAVVEDIQPTVVVES
jgi:site-specific DNA recombinase